MKNVNKSNKWDRNRYDIGFERSKQLFGRGMLSMNRLDFGVCHIGMRIRVCFAMFISHV